MDDVDDLISRIWGEGPKVDLHPDLEGAKKQVDGKWQLCHPLCWFDDYEEHHNHFYNGRYEENKSKLEAAKTAEDWDAYLWIHDKRHWPNALLDIKALVASNEWGEMVRTAWIDADEFWNNEAWAKVALAAKGSAGLMTASERKQLDDMPDDLTLYRGCRDENTEGLSWTISKKRAESFAYKSRGKVWKGTAKKAHTIAFFDRFGEEKEIVILPEHVHDREVVPKREQELSPPPCLV